MKRDMTVVRCDNIKCDHNERGICQLEDLDMTDTETCEKDNKAVD